MTKLSKRGFNIMYGAVQKPRHLQYVICHVYVTNKQMRLDACVSQNDV